MYHLDTGLFSEIFTRIEKIFTHAQVYLCDDRNIKIVSLRFITTPFCKTLIE